MPRKNPSPLTTGATSHSFQPRRRLEPLKGDRLGRFSIRVNDQYRITFRFESGAAHDVRCEESRNSLNAYDPPVTQSAAAERMGCRSCG